MTTATKTCYRKYFAIIHMGIFFMLNNIGELSFKVVAIRTGPVHRPIFVIHTRVFLE